jgi:addiction module HigA family antidote
MITIPGVDPNMIANNLEPAYPTHPGEVLKDEIEYRGISKRKLAAEMDVPYTQLNEVLNAKKPLDAELALLIEAVLDLPAEPLLKMQTRYNMLTAKRNKTFSKRLILFLRCYEKYFTFVAHLKQ